MTARTVNGPEIAERTGAHALTMLADPLNRLILEALASGPLRYAELREEARSITQRMLRCHLGTLTRAGAITKRRNGVLLGSAEYELAEPGRELGFVNIALERWLAGAPEESLDGGGDIRRAAIETLTETWSSTLIRTLAAGPRSFEELGDLSRRLGRRALERQLDTMRVLQFVETTAGSLRIPFVITDWLRRGIGPIVAASRWERRNASQRTAKIGRIDAEAALLLAMPLLRPRPDLSGSCRMIVELPEGEAGGPAMVTVSAEESQVVRWAVPGEEADAWAAGPPNAWFRAAIEADPDHLEIGGDRRLARTLVDSIYGELYGQVVGQVTLRY